MSRSEVEDTMRQVYDDFAPKHLRIHDTFARHAELALVRIRNDSEIGDAERQLIGAAFTHEYAIEAAALCNPSMVRHPSQSRDGGCRFVLSVRGIGEGHRSSIGFRTGTILADGTISTDAPGHYPRTGEILRGPHRADVLRRSIADLGDDNENAEFVFSELSETFDDTALQARLEMLLEDRATRRHTEETVAHVQTAAAASYRVTFDPEMLISERVLWPHAPQESHGMEDARFVEYVDEAGHRSYLATYTAFDGTNIAQHLLATADFESFTMAPLSGAAAVGKGLAIFPRKIGGRFAALSRSDRESNSVAFSDDLFHWDTAAQVQAPDRAWELLQLGNCGSPIETEHGWLVLTHGVGVMRTYSIGAVLLDLDDPTILRGRCPTPLIAPTGYRRAGYVPNVVYSCGGILHGDTLAVPYGVGDRSIRIASMSLRDVVAAMERC